MSDLIVGFGEIGKAVKEAVCPSALVFDSSRPDYDSIDSNAIEVMHICFPYSDDFVDCAKEYIARWQPKHVAIWSTLKIGTTKLVGDNVIHTPTEGRHPKLAKSMRLMPRWIGHNDDIEGAFFAEYFMAKGLEVRPVADTDWTEALKLLSTTEYGVNLAYADYKKRVADAIGMDFELTTQWNADYNELYHGLGLPQFQKFILDPPGGKIGGHCVVPNAVLLNDQYPDTMVEKISTMHN